MKFDYTRSGEIVRAVGKGWLYERIGEVEEYTFGKGVSRRVVKDLIKMLKSIQRLTETTSSV